MSVWTRTRAQLGLPVMGSVIGRVSEMVQHTEAGAPMPATATVAQEIARVQAVHAFHRSLGWQGGGYSGMSFASGRAYEMRGGGRSGSHTQQGRNLAALALCAAGHGDRTPLSEAQIAVERAVIGQWIADGHMTPDPKISGHRDYAAKSCPGTQVYPQLGRLRGVTGPGNTRPPSPSPDPGGFLMALTDAQQRQLADEVSRLIASNTRVEQQLKEMRENDNERRTILVQIRDRVTSMLVGEYGERSGPGGSLGWLDRRLDSLAKRLGAKD